MLLDEWVVRLLVDSDVTDDEAAAIRHEVERHLIGLSAALGDRYPDAHARIEIS